MQYKRDYKFPIFPITKVIITYGTIYPLADFNCYYSCDTMHSVGCNTLPNTVMK